MNGSRTSLNGDPCASGDLRDLNVRSTRREKFESRLTNGTREWNDRLGPCGGCSPVTAVLVGSVRGFEVGLACALGEEEGMEFVHESVIQGSKVLETLRTGLLQPLEEVDLGAGIELFQELGELGH